MINTIMWLASNIILPIFIALATYLVVDRIGEYKKRRTYSRLGIAIIESLQEEVKQGIQIMEKNVEVIHNVDAKFPWIALLPNKSWDGMSTIPDDVLLRIIETSKDKEFDGFNPRDCRIHCKNYFVFINKNFEDELVNSISLAKQEKDWRTPLNNLLVNNGHYLEAANKVYQMLNDAKELLERNAKALKPK